MKIIFSEIPSCSLFADVGCDHGYIGKAMIESGKCDKVIFSDISEPSLKKAKSLFTTAFSDRIKFYVCDGMSFPENPDVVLMAGLGGEEIIKIIKNREQLPEKLVLQPMKNTEKLREFLVTFGYKILKDYVFFSARKYYDIIIAERGKDFLINEEKIFGRTNLEKRPSAFIKRITERREKLLTYLKKDLSEKSKKEMEEEIKRLDNILCTP